jgi:hypothetical protein
MSNKEKTAKKITLTLKNVPTDIYNLLIDKQAENSKKIGGKFGIEPTLYKLLRESNHK